jgi:hypothetical protein
MSVRLATHGLRTPREEIAFTARSKIKSQSQIFRYGGSIFCLPHRPDFSDIFDLCLHWVSVVRESKRLHNFNFCLKRERQKWTNGITIAIKYSGHAIWFGPILRQNLWQLSRLPWKHKHVNATYLPFILEVGPWV